MPTLNMVCPWPKRPSKLRTKRPTHTAPVASHKTQIVEWHQCILENKPIRSLRSEFDITMHEPTTPTVIYGKNLFCESAPSLRNDLTSSKKLLCTLLKPSCWSYVIMR